jgi:hypothetical protein
MAYTYTFTLDDCFLIVTEVETAKTTQQFNLSTLVWETKAGTNISIKDGDDNEFTSRLAQIPAFASMAALVAQLDTWRDGCSLVPAGGFPPAPTNATFVYDISLVTNSDTISAGFQSLTLKNTGNVDITVKGVKMIPGEVITINASLDPVTGEYKKTPAIDYNATAGELKIETLT